ncbi:MAG TPA: polysaccharide pyruvyl transferase family protein [Propionibacteriaceae bacterium]|nr:polysaccharide pyruvyl transferase family protein [Propionibacteriaceae bacterium]
MTAAPRVGFFGRLGSGNLGNDASLEAVLAHVRSEYPAATLDAMCSGPDRVSARYDLLASHLHWLHAPSRRSWPRPVAMALSALRVAAGLCIDAWRTASWVRKHDVAIVPGMGVLEANLVIRPWQEPYSLFLLALFGRLFRTKVALVGVGASAIPLRSSRWLLTKATRHAHYVSYRDEYSRDAMRQMGVKRNHEPVFPDLVFSLPTPELPVQLRTVAVGVMAYWGSNADRSRRQAIHDTYLQAVKEFVRWLLDTGHEVRLLIGDHDDEPEAREVLADARQHWIGGRPAPVDFRPVSTTSALMSRLASVETVVATRFHNVLVALACVRPTLAIAYGNKHRALMAQMDAEEFCQDIGELDVERLKEQFLALQADSEAIGRTLTTRVRAHRELLAHQFAELNTTLFRPWAATKPAGVNRATEPAPTLHNVAATRDSAKSRI